MLNIINEDGTTMEDFPINPLEDKWNKIFPEIPKPEYSQVCDGYSCMWCGRCPKGEGWKVPEEDKKSYKDYMMEVFKYHSIHNPRLYNLIKSNIHSILENI